MPRWVTLCKQGIRTGVQGVVAFVFPVTCPGCGARLPAGEPLGFCATCYGGLPWWNPSQIVPPSLPQVVASFSAPFLYKGALRRTILKLKFADATPLAASLARLMRAHIPLGLTAPLLVAVPCHPKKLRQRLSNQSVLLAHALAQQTGLPFHPTCLKRVVEDAPQKRKTRAARLALPGSHFAATAVVKGKDVILVDDIYTTGATAKACALALKRAGAASVHVRTLAYKPLEMEEESPTLLRA